MHTDWAYQQIGHHKDRACQKMGYHNMDRVKPKQPTNSSGSSKSKKMAQKESS